jgi:hypothetical protein
LWKISSKIFFSPSFFSPKNVADQNLTSHNARARVRPRLKWVYVVNQNQTEGWLLWAWATSVLPCLRHASEKKSGLFTF